MGGGAGACILASSSAAGLGETKVSLSKLSPFSQGPPHHKVKQALSLQPWPCRVGHPLQDSHTEGLCTLSFQAPG